MDYARARRSASGRRLAACNATRRAAARYFNQPTPAALVGRVEVSDGAIRKPGIYLYCLLSSVDMLDRVEFVEADDFDCVHDLQSERRICVVP
ncbi:hypothetical protein HDV57DRAFT_78021 [Trichoderma longibrachiatum]